VFNNDEVFGSKETAMRVGLKHAKLNFPHDLEISLVIETPEIKRVTKHHGSVKVISDDYFV
jgi:hypothetical protein